MNSSLTVIRHFFSLASPLALCIMAMPLMANTTTNIASSSSPVLYIILAALIGSVIITAAAIHIYQTNQKLRNMLRLMRRTDISQRSHNHVLAQIAADESLNSIFNEIIVSIEHARPEMTCSILLVDRANNTLQVAAAPRLPDFYNAAINGLPANQSLGSCGMAITTGKRIIVRDIQHDSAWVGVKDLAATAGFASCWSEPIRNRRGETLGAFAIYQRDIAEPNADDIKLIEESVYLVEIAIEHKYAIEALRESEARHRLLAENVQDVIWTMDLDGQLTYISPSVERQRGYSAAEVMQQTIEQRLTPNAAAKFLASFASSVAAMEAGQPFTDFDIELEHYCKNGTTIWADVRTSGIYDAENNFLGIVGVSRDITERKKSEEKIRYMAQHDSLTGLANRALFADRLAQALNFCKRNQCGLAVMLLDLNKFKPVNDQYGHALGDELLKQVAQRLLDSVRTSDTVARIGGDEFVILLHQIDDTNQAEIVSDKIQAILSNVFFIDERAIQIGCSIGTAFYPQDSNDPRELTKIADQRMYQHKHAITDTNG